MDARGRRQAPPLQKEIVEPDDGTSTLKLTTTYGYDVLGNKTSVAVSGANVIVPDANGALGISGTVTRTTSTQHDTRGRCRHGHKDSAPSSPPRPDR